MKKIYLFLMMACMGAAFTACSSDEDTTPSYADSNKFEPAADDNSELANYRRDFYKNTGTYLLFDDRGVLDVGYDMFSTSTSSYTYTYDYIEDFSSQKKAAEKVKESILKRLGDSSPFSIMIVDKIHAWTYNEGVLEAKPKKDPTYYLGSQCYVFSLEQGKAFTDPSFFDNLIANIVLAKVNAKGDTFLKDFFALIEDYDKYQYYDKYGLGYPVEYNDDLARSLGFLRDGNNWYFRSKKYDISDYVTAVFTYTNAEFEEEFSAYPICIARYAKMKELIESLGVNVVGE